jgi:uncharacterized protein YheU (UPF0270 family)
MASPDDETTADAAGGTPAMGPDAEPLCIPHQELSPAALRGLVEAFVLREGTEYGEHDVPLEAKVAQVMRQLERGEAQVVFDPGTEVVDIVTARSLRRPASR